jgi:hypothetical protein
MRRFLGAGALAALATFVVGATPSSAGPSPEVTPFCEAVADASILFNNAPDEDASRSEQERFATKAERLLGQAEQYAPPELAAQVTTVVTALGEALQVGESPFEDPAIQEAGQAIDEYVVASCGYQVVDVTALEYEFQGIPRTLEPGVTIFRLTNEGAEVHELAIGKIKGDDSAKDIAEGSPEQAEKKLRFAGHAFGLQGQTTFAYVDLKPGSYAALCFIPVGTTDPSALEEEEHGEGTPHTEEGMFRGFKVKKA